MTALPKALEITGPTCSGKSFFLMSESIIAIKVPVAYAILGLVWVTFLRPLALLFLLRGIWRSDKRIWQKIRVFCHVFAKFGYRFTHRGEESQTAIDEGVSHIPFILMLPDNDILKFVDYFAKTLLQIEVIFCVTTEENIVSRLKARGHKRITNDSDLLLFQHNHVRVMHTYLSLLKERGVTLRLQNDN